MEHLDRSLGRPLAYEGTSHILKLRGRVQQYPPRLRQRYFRHDCASNYCSHRMVRRTVQWTAQWKMRGTMRRVLETRYTTTYVSLSESYVVSCTTYGGVLANPISLTRTSNAHNWPLRSNVELGGPAHSNEKFVLPGVVARSCSALN